MLVMLKRALASIEDIFGCGSENCSILSGKMTKQKKGSSPISGNALLDSLYTQLKHRCATEAREARPAGGATRPPISASHGRLPCAA